MTTLEQALTDTFAGLADEAPHDLGLLSRVQVATSRRTRARRLSYVVSSLAAVTAVAVGITAMPFGEAKADRFTDPTGFLVDNRDAAQRFPLTPSYLPMGTSRVPQLDVYERYGTASYLFGGPAVTISFMLDQTGTAPLGSPVSVNGRPGVGHCAANGCYVAWARTPNQFVTVNAVVSLAEVRRIAEGLTDVEQVRRPAVGVGLLPDAGCHLNPPSGSTTSYNPLDGSHNCPVVVEVVAKGEQVRPPSVGGAEVVDSSAVVGGYPGELSELVDGSLGSRHFWYAVLDVPDGRRLVVTTPREGRWDRDELDRFVRAIVLP